MTRNGSARQDGFLEHARERLEGVFRHEHRKDADMTDHSLSQDGRPGQGVNVVLVHGAWADGSSWSGAIRLLQEQGYRCTAVQIGCASLADDVATTRRVLALQQGPTVLVGHSYGGAVISGAGTGASNVVGLVYISAFALDEGETVQDILGRFPAAEGGKALRPDPQGFLWLDQALFREAFAQDVDPVQAGIMAAVQRPIASMIFSEKAGAAAWRTLPSRWLLSEDDRQIHPEAQRWMAERMGATILSLPASHASLVSRPRETAQLIMEMARLATPA